jgi:trimeric autotransporter adhesin
MLVHLVRLLRTSFVFICLAAIGSLTAYAEAPFGHIDTPINGSINQAGAINFTGWALSHSTVAQVALCREPVAGEGIATDPHCLLSSAPTGLVYLGSAVLVPGVRPDVAAAYPGYPNNNWGWGAQILTNYLPGTNGMPLGNGTYKLHAIAADPNNLSTDLGTTTISVNNAASVLPFGTIDTPGQGQTVSGTNYINFGWVVTPQPNIVPIDGSTMVVHIDGQVVGRPTYNNFRSDIATLFPGLRNSNGAVGFFPIDTTTLSNGIHNIDWVVIDSAGHGAGIGSRNFFVQNGAPTMSFTGSPLTISAGSTGTLTLNLSTPAPAGGLTVNLNSSNTGVATVPATVSFAAGAASVPVTVTGVAAGGPVTITASASGLANATASVTVQVSRSIGVPALTSMGLGQSSAFTVTLSAAAPAGGLTVNLASSDTTKVTVPASVTIAAGATTPATQPQVTGAGIGSTSVTASAIGYTPGVGTVTVSAPTMSFTGSPLIIVAGTTGNLTLNLAGGQAPAGGLTVNLTSDTPGVATVPATVTFAAGATSAGVTVTGVAQGSATITASATGIASATASVTVNASGGPTIAISGASVGQNLQTSVILSVSPPAPSGGLNVKVTSQDATKLLVAGHPTDTGVQQVTFTVPQGLSTISGVYLQGLVSTGTVMITASALGYQSGSATITLTPSGFLMTGPGGAASLTTNVGSANSTLTLTAVRLDSSLHFAENQQVSGSLASTAVNVSNSNPSAGTVASPVTFAGGDSAAITLFTPNAVGSTTLTAVAPTGFSTPASGNSVAVTVNPPTLVPSNVTVGKNLETTANVTGATSGLQITVTSNNPSLLLFSTTPTGAGSASIMVTVPVGQNASPDFYVYGLGTSGSVTYTATASGFAPATGTVTLAPSGFVIAGPGGIGAANFTATTANTNINVFAALLDSSGNFVATQSLAGGMSASVNVTSAMTGVGTISTSPVTIPGGSNGATTQFVRGSAGSSDLTVNTPPGFNTPAATYTKVTATVLGMGFSLSCDQATIGQNLEMACTVTVASAGGLSVTLTSNNASLLLLSPTPTAVGSASIMVTIPAGMTSASYYAQALSASGTATHTASASGFTPGTATTPLAPSGVILTGPNGFHAPFFSRSLSAGPVPITVSLAVLNSSASSCSPQAAPCFSGTTQALRGGQPSVQVSLNSSVPSVGTIASPVTITSGSDHAVTQFTPVSQGSTLVSVVTPVAGFTTSTNETSLAASVTTP